MPVLIVLVALILVVLLGLPLLLVAEFLIAVIGPLAVVLIVVALLFAGAVALKNRFLTPDFDNVHYWKDDQGRVWPRDPKYKPPQPPAEPDSSHEKEYTITGQEIVRE